MDFIVSDPNADGGWYVPHDLVAESENGDVLNDAVYARNLHLEETYNFKIKMYPSQTSGRDIQKQINAGDTTYDAIYDSLYSFSNLLTGGYLTDINTVSYINTTKPYWAQDAVEGLTLHDKLCYLCGDMVYYSYMGAPAVYFSKKAHKRLWNGKSVRIGT